MENQTKSAGQIIDGLKESAAIQSMTTQRQQPLDRNWLDSRLKLKTNHHPKLQELEREIWHFWYDLSKEFVTPGCLKVGRLLVIYGENGTGKTHCAQAVCRWARRSSIQYMAQVNHISLLSANTRFWSWPELLDEFKNGNWDIVQDLNECALLVLDELGGGHDPSGVGTDKLCQILSRRESKWTIVTTNIIPSGWEEKFDRRITSRLFRNSVIVDLTGVPDFSLLPSSEVSQELRKATG